MPSVFAQTARSKTAASVLVQGVTANVGVIYSILYILYNIFYIMYTIYYIIYNITVAPSAWKKSIALGEGGAREWVMDVICQLYMTCLGLYGLLARS